MANAKGYRLVHATVVNGIFVDEAYFPRFDIVDDTPAALRADLSLVTWLFQTYDGRLHIAGNRRLRWHDVPIDPRRLQVVPRRLRTFPADFSRFSESPGERGAPSAHRVVVPLNDRQRPRRTCDATQPRASSSPAPAQLANGSRASSTGTPPT